MLCVRRREGGPWEVLLDMANGSIRRHSMAMALCGLMAALALVFLLLGSVFLLATFVCPLLAMICAVPAMCEFGPRPALIQYVCVAVLGVLLAADKELALVYLALGWYPALKPRLDQIRRPLLRFSVKCGVFAAPVAAMYWCILHLFRLEAVVSEFSQYSSLLIALLLILGCFTFLCFDRALGVMTQLYRQRIRGRLFR